MMKRIGVGLGVTVAALTGCQDVIDLDPIDRRAPIESRIRPKPISGGTLLVTEAGLAVASDPDRDLVHVVDVDDRRVLHTIALEAGEEPGRAVEGPGHRVHVVLRGFGGIGTIDTMTGDVLARQHVCTNPRGIAYESAESLLHVACADGRLFRFDEASGEEIGRIRLQPDLRDVMVLDGVVQTSLFRAASVIAEDGTLTTLRKFGSLAPRVAWRTWVQDGQIKMLHQLAETEPVPIEPVVDEGAGLPYGGGGSFCQPGIASTAFSVISEGETITTPIPNARLAVDAAISPDREWLALAMPGAEEGKPSFGILRNGHDGCFFFEEGDDQGQVTAVAFHPSGKLVLQSREPARLLIQTNVPSGGLVAIELKGESRYDTGHEIFHRATESGLSCASCHPEGTEDGHVWDFELLGKRRTQTLDIGLADTAPFHWDGDMGDFDVLMDEVLAHRMGGNRQSKPRNESFTRWMFEQQRPPADSGLDEPQIVSNGEALFHELDCGSCHMGDALGGKTTEPIRGKPLQVPSLRRVSMRAPFMHDGRSITLDDAVQDMVDTTTPAEVTLAEVHAISAYLRTL